MKDFVKDLISGRGTPKQYKKIPLEPLDINWDDVKNQYLAYFTKVKESLTKAEALKEELLKLVDYAKSKGRDTKDFNKALTMIDFYLNGFLAVIEPGKHLHGNKEGRTKIKKFGRKLAASPKYRYVLRKDNEFSVIDPKAAFTVAHKESFIGGLKKSGLVGRINPGYGENDYKDIVLNLISKFELGTGEFDDFKELLRRLREQLAFINRGTTDWAVRLNTFASGLSLDKLTLDPENYAKMIMTKIWDKLVDFKEDVSQADPADESKFYDPADAATLLKNVKKNPVRGVETVFMHLQGADRDSDVYSRMAVRKKWVDLNKKTFEKETPLFLKPLVGKLTEAGAKQTSAGLLKRSTYRLKLRQKKKMPLADLPLRFEHFKRLTGYGVNDLVKGGLIDPGSGKDIIVSRKFSDLGVKDSAAGEYRFMIYDDKNAIEGLLTNFVKDFQVGRTVQEPSGQIIIDSDPKHMRVIVFTKKV